MNRIELMIAAGFVALIAGISYAEYAASQRWQRQERRERVEFIRECREAGGHPVRKKCVFVQPVREVQP